MSELRQHQTPAALFDVHRSHHQKKLKEPSTALSPMVERATHTRLIVFLGLALAASFSLAAAQDFPADVTRGRAVYERHCLACHGVGGWGDGPAAAALRVPPANFHRFTSVLKSDEELLRTIEHGVVFSPMHAWQGILTETERQDALAYIRLLVQQGR